MEKIQISQGYANCSIAIIGEKSAIVTDANIAETLKKFDIDVLYLDYVPDIKLLGKNNEYSQMNGFIGGAMGRIENKIIVFGELKKIDKQGKIKKFIQKYNLEIVDFEGLDVIDYGGILVV